MKRMIAILLLLTLSLSMWGCSSSNGINSNLNQPSNIDPNGFSSLDELAGAYVAMQTGTATSEQLRKLYPETYWNEYIPFDQFYSEYMSTLTDTKESLEKQYGANYTVTYNVMSYELDTDYSTKDIGESDNQEFFALYGANLSERCDYRVTISITISGSITENTKRPSVYFKKIGSKWYG